MRIPSEDLKALLLETSLLNAEDFNSALIEAERTNRDTADVLISRGFLTPEYLAQILSGYFKVPLAELGQKELDETVLGILPEDIARSKNAVVFGKTERGIQTALLDPGDLETISFIEQYTGKKVEPYLATEDDLKYALSQYRKTIVRNFQNVIQEQIRAASRLKIAGGDLAKLATEMPVVAIIDSLISYASSLNASDVHLEVQSDTVLIRFRIDGILREVARLAPEIHAALVARIKILSGLQIDEHAKPQDGRIKFKRGNDVFDIRVAAMPTLYGEKIVMRLLMASAKPLSFAELGMTNDQVALIEQNIRKTFGMVLSTGPTSHGKTTTQYSILNVLNRSETNIVTIEDPIEYELRYVNQIQVNPKAGMDFASGLRAILRQDPNIIMVGEIRDKETAEIAVNAALTGHLVLSTLHTNDAPTAVPRLIDMGVPPFLVAATLNVVMAQRLVRRICSECIESYAPTKSTEESIMIQLRISAPETVKNFVMPTLLYRGKGCKVCGWSGYRGRVAIFEILNVDEQIRNYIVDKNFTIDGLRRLAVRGGLKTMFEDGLSKAERGVTTVEEILRVIRE